MKLFHFSEDPGIVRFEPRPVLTPALRTPGFDWLNGPLVWAIEDAYRALYLFPRDCPRILLWPTAATIDQDQAQVWRGGDWRMVAYIEEAWLDAVVQATLYRYDMPPETFESLDDAGMWVSRAPASPRGLRTIRDLRRALAEARVDLRALPTLTPMKDVWSTTLHASGIRLRNAKGWPWR